jgi:hypothetical protein
MCLARESTDCLVGAVLGLGIQLVAAVPVSVVRLPLAVVLPAADRSELLLREASAEEFCRQAIYKHAE